MLRRKSHVTFLLLFTLLVPQGACGQDNIKQGIDAKGKSPNTQSEQNGEGDAAQTTQSKTPREQVLNAFLSKEKLSDQELELTLGVVRKAAESENATEFSRNDLTTIQDQLEKAGRGKNLLEDYLQYLILREDINLVSLKEKTEDKKTEDKKTEDKKTEDKKTEDKKTEDKKTEDKKTEDKKTEDKKTEDKKTEDKKTEDKKTEDKKTEDKKTEDKKTEDKKTEDKKTEDKKTEDKKTEDKKTEDKKTEDKKTEDKKTEDKKTEDKKTEDKKTEDKKTEDKKTEDKKTEDKKTEDKKTEDKKTEDKKTEDKKTEDKKTEDKKTEDKKTEDKKTEDKKTEDKKTEDKKTEGLSAKEYVKRMHELVAKLHSYVLDDAWHPEVYQHVDKLANRIIDKLKSADETVITIALSRHTSTLAAIARDKAQPPQKSSESKKTKNPTQDRCYLFNIDKTRTLVVKLIVQEVSKNHEIQPGKTLPLSGLELKISYNNGTQDVPISVPPNGMVVFQHTRLPEYQKDGWHHKVLTPKEVEELMDSKEKENQNSNQNGKTHESSSLEMLERFGNMYFVIQDDANTSSAYPPPAGFQTWINSAGEMMALLYFDLEGWYKLCNFLHEDITRKIQLSPDDSPIHAAVALELCQVCSSVATEMQFKEERGESLDYFTTFSKIFKDHARGYIEDLDYDDVDQEQVDTLKGLMAIYNMTEDIMKSVKVHPIDPLPVPEEPSYDESTIKIKFAQTERLLTETLTELKKVRDRLGVVERGRNQRYSAWRHVTPNDYWVSQLDYEIYGKTDTKIMCLAFFSENPAYVYFFNPNKQSYIGRINMNTDPQPTWEPVQKHEHNTQLGVRPVQEWFGPRQPLPVLFGSNAPNQKLIPPSLAGLPNASAPKQAPPSPALQIFTQELNLKSTEEDPPTTDAPPKPAKLQFDPELFKNIPF